MNEEPDDWRLHYDPDELIRAYLKWERSGFVRMPHPGEDDDQPAGWVDDMMTIGQLLQFQRDGLPKKD